MLNSSTSILLESLRLRWHAWWHVSHKGFQKNTHSIVSDVVQGTIQGEKGSHTLIISSPTSIWLRHKLSDSPEAKNVRDARCTSIHAAPLHPHWLTKLSSATLSPLSRLLPSLRPPSRAFPAVIGPAVPTRSATGTLVVSVSCRLPRMDLFGGVAC